MDKHGATTMWERWDGWTETNGFQDPGMNSFNHYAYGACGQWMFTTMAGINTGGLGFEHILIRPRPGGGISYVKASYDSISGKIATKWQEQDDGSLTLQVTIPPNTKATVCVPKSGMDSVVVYEGGVPVWSNKSFHSKVKGLTEASEDSDSVNFKVGSGIYDFKVVRE